MINLDDVVPFYLSYNDKRRVISKGFYFGFGVFTFLELGREQIAEVNILQLIPGFYLFLIFSSLFVLTIASDFFSRAASEMDNQSILGTKTNEKLDRSNILKNSFSLWTTITVVSFNSIIPISLDFFSSYGANIIENFWSLDEIINLELTLLLSLSILSQTPLFTLALISTEEKILDLPRYWRIATFGSLVLSGILTPTVDGATQVGFACFTVVLYFFSINALEKSSANRSFPVVLWGSD